VPHVASEATKHALKPALPNPARSAPSSERAQGSPFESLLDSDTPPSPAPAPAGKKTAPAARSNAAQAPGKTDDRHAAKSRDDAKTDNAGDTAQAAKSDATKKDCKVRGDGKPAPDAKICDPVTAGADGKPASDDKTADAKTADGTASAALAADPAGIPIQPAAPVAAVVVTPAPATDQQAPNANPQAASATAPIAIAATEIPEAKPTDLAAPPTDVPKATPAVPAVPAVPQTGTEKTTGNLPPPAKPAVELADNGKPQSDAVEPAKPDTHPHGEVAANPHRTAPETPAPVAADAQAAAPKVTGDAAQQAALTAPSRDAPPVSATAAPAPAPSTPPAVAVPLAGIAIEIAGKALAGKNRFEIRLDPPELGRIEVRLDVDRDGHVTSRLIADRSDTLDLLRRDASGLERALQDAGLKTADNGLQFSLRDQSMGREQTNTALPAAAQIVAADDTLPAAELNARSYSRLAGLGGGIDIRV
jgi:flagellar hook-length control protein FliK